MLHETINLSEDGRVTLTSYIHDVSLNDMSADEAWNPEKRPFNGFQIANRPAIIVCPGGGFQILSDREAEPVALTFMKEGFNTFVLRYSIGEYSAFPNPLDDISKAIWVIRSHAEEWDLNPDAISIMGFSAGASVCAMSATEWNMPGLCDRLGIPEGGNKPNAAIIGYGPVLVEEAMEDSSNVSVGAILKENPPQLSAVNYVGPHCPPAFIWHTRYDPLVSPANALALASAYQKADLKYELHIYTEGTHGLSVNNDLSDYRAGGTIRPLTAHTWVDLCTVWLKRLFNIC